VEVVIKQLATLLIDFVASDTLDWKALIQAMGLSNNNTMHRTTMNTTFFLTYNLDYRIPHFNSKPDYNENFKSELSGRMKIAREVIVKHMEEKSQNYEANHNKKATAHK
jgi:hypothetical protein